MSRITRIALPLAMAAMTLTQPRVAVGQDQTARRLPSYEMQQEKINALQNAGLMDVQRANFAALKAEFAAVTSGQGQSAPLKARR